MRKFSQVDSRIDAEFKHVDERLVAVERQVPIGTILLFSGVMPPPGYLWCDGNEYGREVYPVLADVMGRRGGSPSSESKFKVPNLTEGLMRYVVRAT